MHIRLEHSHSLSESANVRACEWLNRQLFPFPSLSLPLSQVKVVTIHQLFVRIRSKEVTIFKGGTSRGSLWFIVLRILLSRTLLPHCIWTDRSNSNSLTLEDRHIETESERQ